MIEHNGTNWIIYHGALVPDVSPHIEHGITDQDIRFLLRTSHAYFLRWHTKFDMPRETAYWHVIKNGHCDLQELSKNTRNQVRKGLNNCTVRMCTAADLSHAGYEVYRKAMENYKSDLRIWTATEFCENLTALSSDDAYDFWGVWNNAGNLVAYAQNKIKDNCCNYQVIKLDPHHLHLYSGYALIFEMNCYYLNKMGLLYVNDGARSIRHNTGVQDFLIKKFRFRKAYSHLHIAYNYKIGSAVRVLFPFRSIIERIPGSLTKKASALLGQEEIHRQFSD